MKNEVYLVITCCDEDPSGAPIQAEAVFSNLNEAKRAAYAEVAKYVNSKGGDLDEIYVLDGGDREFPEYGHLYRVCCDDPGFTAGVNSYIVHSAAREVIRDEWLLKAGEEASHADKFVDKIGSGM